MGSGTENTVSKVFFQLRECTSQFFSEERKNSGAFYAPSEVLRYADFRELLALKYGLKPSVGLRIPFEPQAYKPVKDWAKKNSFEMGHTTQKYIINSNKDICQPISLDDPRQGDVYAIIADSFDLVKRGADSYARDSVEFGRVMGYPECCLEFAKTLNGNVGKTEEMEQDFVWSRTKFRSFRNSDYFSYYLNSFHGFGVIPHTPCSLNCKPSKRYAKKMLGVLKKEDTELGKCIEFFLKIASFFWRNMDYVLLDGTWHKEKFHYTSSMPFLGSDTFYMVPDKSFMDRLKDYFLLVERGNSLEVFDDCVKVFSGDDLLGLIEKKSKYECIITKPDGP